MSVLSPIISFLLSPYGIRAEAAAKAKLEKVAEIKRLNAYLIATKK